MSGGSYDYLYSKIQDAANSVNERGTTRGPLRAAFAVHLHLVAKAMQHVEWVDSCDSSPGAEDDAIRACLAPGAECDAAREALEAAMVAAGRVLERTRP
ncbi:MAG: hypothetical protein WDA27_14305 [Actinomycetota bacterium]